MRNLNLTLEADWKEIKERWISAIISIVRYIFLFFIGAYIAVFLEPALEHLYRSLFPHSGGGFGDIDFTGVAIYIYTAIFIIPILFIVLGDRRRYVAVIIYVIPQIIIEVIANGSYWSFYIPKFGTLLAAIVVGFLIRLVASHTLGKMLALQPLKKYF